MTFSMIDSPENILAQMDTLCKRLLAAAADRKGGRLSGAELEALTRGGCMYLTVAPESADMAEAIERAWTESLERVNSAIRHDRMEEAAAAETLLCLLAMYHVAYGPTTLPADCERAGICDNAAFQLLTALLNGEHRCSELMMLTAVELYRYAAPEDLDEEEIPNYFRTTAERWDKELPKAEETMMLRLAVLEAGADVFGTPRAVTLPPAKNLTTIESLISLCHLLSLRGSDTAALREACSALGQRLDHSPDRTAAMNASASLLEALSILYFTAEEDTATLDI